VPSASPTSSVAKNEAAPPTFRSYHAPQRHGEAFFDPDLDQAAAIIARNQSTLKAHGPQWAELRKNARSQLIQDALRYTSSYRDVQWARQKLDRQPTDAHKTDAHRTDAHNRDLQNAIDSQSPAPPRIVMAGHQPTLFHPGVWFKNFTLSHLGRQTDSIAINLVIDNDVAAGGSIRVPTFGNRPVGNRPVDNSMVSRDDEIIYTSVAYDRAGGGVPFEQTTVDDREIFSQFDQAVYRQIAPLVPNPCVQQLWQHARRAIERCGVAGCALAQARHGLEGDIGLQTLELPMSVVSRGKAFAQFALMILGDLPRFHDAYNQSARVYRKAHGIRSTAHPVPDLQRQVHEGETWYEAPLWVYGNDDPSRKSVWAKVVDDELTISDRQHWQLRIDLRDRNAAIEKLAASASPDCKLRPRALLTTMYARCVLCDLFLHGIGGGKYDQLGDMITQSFFQLAPTEFMVVSATIQLPGVEPKDFDEQIRRTRRLLRDTQYQPENFADQVTLDPDLLSEKADLLRRVPPRGEREQWHQEIERVNRRLSQSLSEIASALRSRLAELRSAKESQSRLASREHSFCLYPLDYLVDAFDSLLKPDSK
tara:strand:- start:78492 stop:80267 length:1776 start_codon:yes stop_codon:yes gene_type:complete